MENVRLADRNWFRMVDESKRWTPWKSEELMGGIVFNSIERCCSKNPSRGEKQKTSESDRRRRGTPTPKPLPTQKPSRSPSEVSATSEMSVSSEGSSTMRFFHDSAVEYELAETDESTEVSSVFDRIHDVVSETDTQDGSIEKVTVAQ